jgi:thioredoxin 1
LIAAGALIYWLWQRWQLRRLQPRAARRPGLETWQAGRPGILYFTTPDCAPCRTAQRPALERLRAEWDAGLQVIEIDASARAAVADHWGVLSVPTTFVLDAAGAPRYINPGVTNAAKLKQQLAALGEGPRDKGVKAKDYSLTLNL